jgi:hypothetical protein
MNVKLCQGFASFEIQLGLSILVSPVQSGVAEISVLRLLRGRNQFYAHRERQTLQFLRLTVLRHVNLVWASSKKAI